MNKTEISVLLECFILLLGLYLAFFKSYFTEKGKNIATKEDIEDITKKVENVKSEVEILTKSKINLLTEKKNCLLKFNGCYNSWVNYCMHLDIVGDAGPGNNYLLTVQGKLDVLYHDLGNAEADLDVYFFDDRELISYKDNLKIEALKLSHLASKYLVEEDGVNNLLNIVRAIPDTADTSAYKKEKLNEHYAERIRVNSRFQSEKIELYRSLAKLNYRFFELIYKRVYQILE